MKKIIIFLLVIFSFFTTFVSAQDSVNKTKEVVFTFDTITLLKGDNPSQDRAGHYELVFSTTPGIIFFRDTENGAIMKITLGRHVLDQAIVVLYKQEKTPATVMCFDADIRGYNVTFATVVLDNKEKTIFAFGITLENYSIMMKVKDK